MSAFWRVWIAGVVERLRISRAGSFSCPVRAGVVFLASYNPDALPGQEAIVQALQACCRLFSPLVQGCAALHGSIVHQVLREVNALVRSKNATCVPRGAGCDQQPRVQGL
jgi:hypothetical protein